MAIHSSKNEITAARETLLRWAAHIAHSREAQEDLINRTIVAATDNPFELADNEPVDRALMSLMLRIAQGSTAGTSIGPDRAAGTQSTPIR